MVYGDGYEYEVERDERAAFLRASKLDRFRIEQAKQPVKKRRLEVSHEDSASSSNESEDDEYMEELAERVSGQCSIEGEEAKEFSNGFLNEGIYH